MGMHINFEWGSFESRRRVGVTTGDILDVINSWPHDRRVHAHKVLADFEDQVWISFPGECPPFIPDCYAPPVEGVAFKASQSHSNGLNTCMASLNLLAECSEAPGEFQHCKSVAWEGLEDDRN
jgi:hypothetical protein